MSEHNFSETSTDSWFSRIGSSIKGIVFGIVLILVSIFLISWNEGRAVKRYKTLKEGAGVVVSVDATQIDSSKETKLVHISGPATTEDKPSDPLFGISVDAIKLVRVVEMYQWKESQSKETKKKLGGSTETVTTYSYSKEWSEAHVDSSKFKKSADHQNPSDFPFTGETFIADDVYIGAYLLSNSQLAMINTSENYSFSDNYEAPVRMGKSVVNPGSIFLGQDIKSPEVGDLRVSFRLTSERDLSLIAKQVGNTFEPYQTKVGGSINLLLDGIHSADGMIQSAQDSNKTLAWILRGVGFMILFFGFNLVLAPLSVIADLIPFLGNLIGTGTMLISLLLSVIVGFITVAVAWILFRPILAAVLIALCLAAAYAIVSNAKSKKIQAS